MPHCYRQGRPTIGVLAGWQFAWTATPLSYLDPIFHGICLAARDKDCNVLLGCGMGSRATPRDLLRPAWPVAAPDSDFVPIGPWNTDGLIAINPLHAEARSRYMQDLRAAGHPVLFVGAGEPGPTVLADNRGGMLGMLRHLVEHGHQQIAFIAGSPEDLEGDSGDRLQAYHDAVAMYGLATDPRLIAWGRHVYANGYSAMREILASGAPFTAVAASNDESALGAMQALREAGRRIPDDVAITGFDDRPESAAHAPPLSSVHVPLQMMGYRAGEALIAYLRGQTTEIASLRVATHLVPRESCGCAPHAPRPAATGQPVHPVGAQALPKQQDDIAYTMASLVAAEDQRLHPDQVTGWCQRLVGAFTDSVQQGNPAAFQATLAQVLAGTHAAGGEVAAWHAALSALGADVDRGIAIGSAQAQPQAARTWLDQAHAAIGEHQQRQQRQYVVEQRWMLNRLGTLTAHLLAALDETQVYDVLAQQLPELDISVMWIALLEVKDDDPTAWTTLRPVTGASAQDVLRFRSTDFPPEALLPSDRPFSLALFPLAGPQRQLGFAVYDTTHLELCGAITQEVATALNSAQLYREATEGRHLAEEANELKSRFLSTVSHELRTPLNLIVGLSGIVLQESEEHAAPLPGRYRRDLENIHANAQHLSGLIGDVLDLASSDAGQLRLTQEYIELSEVLRLVAETGRQLAQEKGLDWHAELPAPGPWVWADRTRLRQIVLNLVNNAIKFTAKGQVSLCLTSDDETVSVSVSDTGLGIPPAEQSIVFDEFRRSERSMGGGYGGLGLGLAICKRLVELQGGTIGVTSSGREGAGSTFTFHLPRVQPPASPSLAPDTARTTGESVLVLTNRAGNHQRLHEHLREHGFDVRMTFVDETPDWLPGLLATPPGTIVIDVSVASHQGWNVLKTLKGHTETQHLPVLFYTLSQEGGAVLELDYLTKPIELADFERALDQHWLAVDGERSARTILVVDDDPNTLEMHARIAQAQSPSHRVLKAPNGRVALDVLRRELVDLVLLDLMMPELDGFGVLNAMRESDTMRDIPVIVLTGQILTEHDVARLNRGVVTVLSKGVFSFEETLAHVELALARNRELSDEAVRSVRQAMAYIHEHYAESISRADIARHVALSDDYLTFCFRKAFGVTPIAYLNRFRVNQAKRLLTETLKSITEIALEVGFSDSGYFGRVFRREVGQSPQAYRQP